MFVKLNAPCQITSIGYLAVGIPGYEWLAVEVALELQLNSEWKFKGLSSVQGCKFKT